MAPPETESLGQDFDADLTYISETQIAAKVSEGQAIIVFANKVYNLTKWIKHHPGGELAVRHMVGKDATDEIRAQHPDWVITKKLPCFYVGELHLTGTPWKPSLKSSSLNRPIEHQKISADWKRLETKLKREGFFETDFKFYYGMLRTRQPFKGETKIPLLVFRTAYAFITSDISEIHINSRTAIAARLAFFWIAAVALVTLAPPHPVLRFISAFLIAIVWQQGAFMAHDAGHNGISHNLKIDRKIGLILGNFVGGISIGWWKKSHNVHHIVTNHPEHDPDIQHLPFFAISTRLFESVYSSYHKRTLHFDAFSKTMVSIQHFLFYPIMSLARPNLYAQSYLFLLFDENISDRKLEITGLVCFWIWYITLLSFLPSWSSVVAYVLVSHMLSGLLHLQISLSHFGMSTEDRGDGESFAAKMLRTTMDVDCPEWLDWFHGGLQFQTIHHLYPRIPRHNLRKVQPYIQRFCSDHHLTYHLHTFSRVNTFVLGSMKEVADQVAFVLSTAVPEKLH